MITRKGIFIGLLILLLGFLAYRIGAYVLRPKKVQMAAEQTGIPVAVTQVGRQSIEATLILTGDVRGLNEARVYPQVPGRLLRKIKEVGDLVKKDEVIALVDRNEPALQFAPAEVTSPLQGVLTRYLVDLGAAVTPSTPICEVADIWPVKIAVNVAEKDLPEIKAGQSARFFADAYPNETFSGRVTRISEALNLASRSAEVEIYSENPGGRLKPGMFVKVEIITSVHSDAVVVPREAVAELGGNYYAFVIENQKARHRDLKVGIMKSQQLEILSGLNPGETLVTLGWHNLTEGTAVEVVQGENSSSGTK